MTTVHKSLKFLLRMVAGVLLYVPMAHGQQVLVEAESFSSPGGWKLDTQFIDEMGSPYLLAHGLGRPVKDATTEVTFPETGTYHVYARTKDWVARWGAKGAPGQFQLLIEGKPLSETFGTKGAEWFWHDGGTVEVKTAKVSLALRDLTGFAGRCDAILFTKTDAVPPNESTVLPAWRRQLLGLKDGPTNKDDYDLVVIGGGYSGMGAALSAARAGCKVALIQNRPVLGGNGSSEVRVWAMGLIRRGKYPRIGEMIEEVSDHASKSPGTYAEFEDAKKDRVLRAEPNIDLFLNHHAYKVETAGDQVVAVHAFDTRTSEHKRFSGRLFADCTGHGTIGFLAGADWEMTPGGRMGMSNMWAWDEGEQDVAFPKTPWALDLAMADFPYPRDHHGQWFWESGFDQDPLNDAEGIRDWNFRAVYGAFNAMKNRDGADQHKNAFLTWIAYIGGPRESRRLLGDVILNKEDVVSKREFNDGCVPSTWSVDLHYPKKQYAKKFPDNPFISIAIHDRRVDRSYGYPVPYRSFYSRNIKNLFMAGRCASVTHEALGTTRVMKTCGMMGEVVGKAASVCKLHDCLPRDVYERYWGEMDNLLKLPGKARRNTVNEAFVIPKNVMPEASSRGVLAKNDPARMSGVVIDNLQAKLQGDWKSGTNLKGYVGSDYVYAPADSGATIRFETVAKKASKSEIVIAYQPHENRGTRVPVTVQTGNQTKRISVDMTKPPRGIDGKVRGNGTHSLGVFEIQEGQPIIVSISTEGSNGVVHADAVQVLPESKEPWNPDFSQMLQPVPEYAKFIDEGYYIWGASMVQDENGKSHLFYSRWPREMGHYAWVTHSEIAHAVADQPLGPYKHVDVALPARGKEIWDGLCTHNPTVHRFGDKYYLYYMGNTGDGKNLSTINWVHRNNQRIGVAVADSPDGPWQRFDQPLIDVGSDEDAGDALLTSNPSVCRRKDGKYLLAYKAVGKRNKAPQFGPVVHMVATSNSPTGPFEKHPDPVFAKKGDQFPGEDPFIWRGRQGKLWAILKDMHGAYTDAGRSLVLFQSENGLDWKLAEHPLVSKLQINWKESGVQKVLHLERPQLWFEYGNPVILFCAADEEPSRGHSFSVAIPLLER